VLITIRKAIDASPELRSKKQLIETFIAGVNDVDDVMAEWNTYVSEQREKELAKIIQEERMSVSSSIRIILALGLQEILPSIMRKASICFLWIVTMRSSLHA